MTLRPEIEQLVIGLIPDAERAAKRIFHGAPHALDPDDLRSLAYVGLVSAAREWDNYCARNKFSPDALQYFRAYVMRRVRGAMLDEMRSKDWMTRSGRTRAKALRDAGADLGRSELELAQATGLSVRQVRETMAAAQRRPVYLDDSDHDPADSDDVESSAVVTSVLDAVTGRLRLLSAGQQAVISLRYHQGRELPQIAEALGMTLERVRELHDSAVLELHAQMVRSVSLWPLLPRPSVRPASSSGRQLPAGSPTWCRTR